MANLRARGALSVKLVALLDKFERRERAVEIDYLGFKIPDAFVVGYGLDFAERYRNLPYIAVLKNPEVQ
jgi:hypoxanthine phosphoribosyltransferase